MKDAHQSTHQVIMIEPVNFMANPQTMATNLHQKTDQTPNSQIQQQALEEHRRLVQKLRDVQIEVTCYQGRMDSPDDLFCNNWVSFHNHLCVFYPMYAENRRLERREDLCVGFKAHYETLDFSAYESKNQFLESTGSMVLDRVHRVAYAALSPRTDKQLFYFWCDKMGYTPVAFSWFYPNKQPVYHTNVIMFIGTHVAGICSEGIAIEDRERVLTQLKKHHEVIDLSFEQIHHFCGNMLELSNPMDEHYLCMSTQAFEHFSSTQIQTLERYGTLLHSPIPTIEKYGGGSVRCLILEVF